MWPLPIVVAVVNSCTQPWVEHARAKKNRCVPSRGTKYKKNMFFLNEL